MISVARFAVRFTMVLCVFQHLKSVDIVNLFIANETAVLLHMIVEVVVIYEVRN